MFLIRCYKDPIFHKMSISIPGMKRSCKNLVSGGCVVKMIQSKCGPESREARIHPITLHWVYVQWCLFQIYPLRKVERQSCITWIMWSNHADIPHVTLQVTHILMYTHETLQITHNSHVNSMHLTLIGPGWDNQGLGDKQMIPGDRLQS